MCLVSFEFPPKGGGEGTYTYNLLRGLSTLGHSVFLVIPAQERISPLVVPEATRVIPVGEVGMPISRVAGFLLGAREVLPALAAREGIDVTHFTFDYPTLPVRYSRVKVPLVATVHHLHFVEAINVFRHHPGRLMNPYFAKQFLLTKMERSFIKNMDGLIAVSDFTRRSMLENGMTRSPIQVIHNGIDADSFEGNDGARFRTMFGLKDRPYVLYVGRLDVSKGIEYLLQAYGKVRTLFPEVMLVLVGRGPTSYVRTLKAKSRAVAGDGVLFTGYLDPEALRSAYAGSSLVVLPSLMEGLGVTLLEGMAASRACVATRVGGVPEIIEDGKTGVLVEPGNAASLAQSITKLLSDPVEAGRIGENARSLVRKEFTIERMAEKTQSVYGGILRTSNA